MDGAAEEGRSAGGAGHRTETKTLYEARRRRRDKGILVLTPKGTLFRSSDVGKKAFRTAAKDLGLPELTWRSFQRSVETLLFAELGMDQRRQALGKIQSLLLPNVGELRLELQLTTGK